MFNPNVGVEPGQLMPAPTFLFYEMRELSRSAGSEGVLFSFGFIWFCSASSNLTSWAGGGIFIWEPSLEFFFFSFSEFCMLAWLSIAE